MMCVFSRLILLVSLLHCCEPFFLPASPRPSFIPGQCLKTHTASRAMARRRSSEVYAQISSSHPAHLEPPNGVQLEQVDPFWSWNKRTTGVDSKWSAHVGVWSWFDAQGLSMSPPQPFTSGRIRKCLKQATGKDPDDHDGAFELFSVFEEGAQGPWKSGTQPRDCDPHSQLRHTFEKAPWRMRSMAELVPQEYVGPWPADNDVLRVTVVQPGECTASGMPYIPPLDVVQDAIRRGEAVKHRISYELWLSETVAGVTDAVKSGLFLQYDTVSGSLVSFLNCRELSLAPPEDLTGARMCMPRFAASQAEAGTLNPAAPVNFELLSQAAGQLNASSTAHLASPSAVNLRAGAPVHGVVSAAGWRGRARLHRLVDGPASAEVAWEARGLAASEWHGVEGDRRYLDVRLGAALYAAVPASLSAFERDLRLEFGSLRSAEGGGGLQRVVVLGDRAAGGFHTLCHEVWE